MTPSLVRSSSLAPLLCLAIVTACEEDPSGPRTEERTWQVFEFAGVNDAGVAAASVVSDTTNVDGDAFFLWRAAMWTVADGVEVLPLADDMVEMMAIDINEAGHVLAEGTDRDLHHHAFVWNGSAWNYRGEFYPTGIDEQGNVVGFTWDWDAQSQERTPVLRYAGGPLVELGGTEGIGACATGPSAVPLDISAAGIVGVTMDWAESFHWITPSSVSLLFEYQNCIDGEESIAEAINDDGVIVGWSGELEGGFVREPDGEPAPLALLPNAPSAWARSCAYGVSSNAWIAGMALNSEGEGRAVRWSPAGEIDELGPGRAVDVNASGLTVGEIAIYSGHPLVWLPDDTQIDLPVAELPDDDEAAAAPRDPRSWPC